MVVPAAKKGAASAVLTPDFAAVAVVSAVVVAPVAVSIACPASTTLPAGLYLAGARRVRAGIAGAATRGGIVPEGFAKVATTDAATGDAAGGIASGAIKCLAVGAVVVGA